MALVTFNRATPAGRLFSKVLTDSGYSNVGESPFLGAIMAAISEALTTRLNELYEISQNVDIGRATGEYLDRWGRFLNEPRITPSYAQDLSLTNVYIELSPSDNAGTLTTDGVGITIPAGTTISGEGTEFTVSLIDDVYIRADRSRAYCRVVSDTAGTVYIPAGALDTVGVELNEVTNILPSAVNTHTLVAGNTAEVSGGAELANDATYQYTLQQKAASLGLFNENRVNTLMDMNEIASVYVHEYTGGAIVYVDTTTPALTEAVVESSRALLTESRTLGQSVQVYTPIDKTLKLRLQIEVRSSDQFGELSSMVVEYIVNQVNTHTMGDTVRFSDIVTDAKDEIDDVIGIRIIEATSGGRTVTTGYIPLHYNERLTMTEGDITVV